MDSFLCKKSSPVASDPSTWPFRSKPIAIDGHPFIVCLSHVLPAGEFAAGTIPVHVARAAATYMLLANYDLSFDQAKAMILGVEPSVFGDAVLDATVNIDPPAKHWTAWARSALLANGLDPAKVPADDLLATLNQLVQTGRAVPPQDWTDAGIAAAKRGGLDMLRMRIEGGG